MHKVFVFVTLYYFLLTADSQPTETLRLTSEEYTLIRQILNYLSGPSRQPKSDVLQLSKEKECLSKRRVLADGECYILGTKGPCDHSEHFVLDEVDESIKAICRVKPCTGRNEVWWPETGKCELKTWIKSEHCRERNKSVFVNSFGEAVCACAGIFGEIEEECYEYYQRGPCNANEVVTYNSSSGEAECSVDRCLQLNMKSDKSGPNPYEMKRNLYAPYEGYGECFQLGSPNPCQLMDTQSRFVVDATWHLPRCSSTTVLTTLDPKIFCKLQDGECRQHVDIQQDDSDVFLGHLVREKNKKKKKKSGKK